jgi:hypothetical protein
MTNVTTIASQSNRRKNGGRLTGSGAVFAGDRTPPAGAFAATGLELEAFILSY